MSAMLGVVPSGGVWTAWSVDPLVAGGILLAGWLYATGVRRATRPPARWRRRAFVLGLTAVGIALVSPLEAMAADLLSAHMAQHVLLSLVAAPALAAAAPSVVLLRGAPLPLRRTLAGLRGRTGTGTPRTRAVWGPWLAFGVHVAVLWVWHAQVLYEAALTSPLIHAIEHLSILGAALLLWGMVAGAHGARQVERGQAILVVFGAGVAGVLLSALLVFSRQPWYPGYRNGPSAWGLTPLADQQLAGAILSTAGTVVHLTVVLVLLVAWLRQADAGTDATTDAAR